MKINEKEFKLLRIELKVLLSWLGFVIGVMLFMVIASLVRKGSISSMDNQILLDFRVPGKPAIPLGGGGMLEVMRDITALGGATVVFMITLFVAVYFLLRKNYSSLLLLIIAVIGGSLLGFELKTFFGRPRPEIIPHLMFERSLSFPSGHSMMSAVIYLSLAALIAEGEHGRKIKIYFIMIAVLLSFLIGVSRVYLGVHNPSDVAAGWAVGTAWACLCWYIAWYIRRRKLLLKD